MIVIYGILLLMTLLGALAAFLLKRAMGYMLLRSKGFWLNFGLGGLFYLIAAILNIYVLRLAEYSIVLPMTSLTYVWTLLLGVRYLDEQLTVRKGIGVLLIVVGAVVLGSLT